MKKSTFFACFATLAMVACGNQAPAEKQSEASANTVQADSTAQATVDYNSDIAFVNTDAVMAQSEFYKTEGVALQEKTQKSQESWAKTEQGFQWEISQLQEKAQKGLITSANYQKESSNIERRYKSFQTKTQKEAQTLDEESQVLSNRANDLMQRAITELNADKKYKVVLNAAMILEPGTISDQTNTVLEIVNRLYAAEK